jgi:hypothetical protein
LRRLFVASFSIKNLLNDLFVMVKNEQPGFRWFNLHRPMSTFTDESLQNPKIGPVADKEFADSLIANTAGAVNTRHRPTLPVWTAFLNI